MLLPRRTPFNAGLVGKFKSSIFTEMTLLANKHQAVNLGQGFPDFNPQGELGTKLLNQAAREIVTGGKNQYCRSSGVIELCRAIQQQFAEHQQQQQSYNADSEVTVFAGATEAIFATLTALLTPGDDVVLFQPHYDSYLFAVEAMQANARVVTLRPTSDSSSRFTFSREELEHAFVGDGKQRPPKVLILNSPHNPTGTVFSRDELDFIAQLCIKHDTIVVSDEVYEHITFDDKHVSIATLPGMRNRTVSISSAGKTFSVTGWKIGWALAGEELTHAIRTCHQYITFSSATPFQHALASAMSDSAGMRAFIGELQRDYKHKRDKLCEGLERAGLKVAQQPQGAYFALVDVSSQTHKRNDVDFARFLTQQVGVCAIPNSAFYSQPTPGETDKYVRFAFCKTDPVLDAGIERLVKHRRLLE